MPEDYGLVAAAMLVVGLIQTFLDFGATTALLRMTNPTRDDIDSTWTLKVIQGIVAGITLFALADMAGEVLQKPGLTNILWALSVAIVFASLSNIGLTLAIKEFDFKVGARVDVVSKIASVSATLLSGVVLKNHWALVVGIMVGYLSPLLLSYIWHAYRPKWNTSKIPEIWKLTKWLLLASIGSFVLRKGDELIAAKIGSSHEYGLYNVGSDLGQLPVQEIGPAMIRALLPVLSSMESSDQYINSAVEKTTAAVNIIIWPIAFGFAAISSQVTEVILGSKWHDAAVYVYAFAIISALQTSTAPIKTLLTLRGHTRVQSMQVWREFAVFVVTSLVLTPHIGLYGLVIARAVASVANMFDVIRAATNLCRLNEINVFKSMLRPIIFASAMAIVVCLGIINIKHPILTIAGSAAAGGVLYSLAIYLSWRALGKPDGIEVVVLNQARKLRARFN